MNVRQNWFKYWMRVKALTLRDGSDCVRTSEVVFIHMGASAALPLHTAKVTELMPAVTPCTSQYNVETREGTTHVI